MRKFIFLILVSIFACVSVSSQTPFIPRKTKYIRDATLGGVTSSNKFTVNDWKTKKIAVFPIVYMKSTLLQKIDINYIETHVKDIFTHELKSKSIISSENVRKEIILKKKTSQFAALKSEIDTMDSFLPESCFTMTKDLSFDIVVLTYILGEEVNDTKKKRKATVTTRTVLYDNKSGNILFDQTFNEDGKEDKSVSRDADDITFSGDIPAPSFMAETYGNSSRFMIKLFLYNFDIGVVEGDCLNGIGKFEFNRGVIYDGSWKDGFAEGSGILYVKDFTGIETKVEGEWKHGAAIPGKSQRYIKPTKADGWEKCDMNIIPGKYLDEKRRRGY